jgi:hypothetical protein
MLCFIEARLPQAMAVVDGIRIVAPPAVLSRIGDRGPLGPQEIDRVARHLHVRLPL